MAKKENNLCQRKTVLDNRATKIQIINQMQKIL
jgi:hypothetical protein